jgi:hypothetical protein
MGADWIIVGVVIATVLLLLVTALLSKFKKYRLVSPIKKIEPKKRRAKPGKKKRKAIVIKLI